MLRIYSDGCFYYRSVTGNLVFTSYNGGFHIRCNGWDIGYSELQRNFYCFNIKKLIDKIHDKTIGNFI